MMTVERGNAGADFGFIPDPEADDVVVQQYFIALDAFYKEGLQEQPHQKLLESLEEYIYTKYAFILAEGIDPNGLKPQEFWINREQSQNEVN